jgi:hypothetical protein
MDPLLFIAAAIALLCIFVTVFVNSKHSKNEQQQKRCVTLKALKKCKLKNLSFRFYKPEDEDTCLQIYRDNEQLQTIPENCESDYLKWLRGDTGTRFIIQRKGEIIASCGMTIDHNLVFLIYGLISPKYQKLGLGTVMLALRTLQLAPTNEKNHLVLNATKHSFNYYLRYGFTDLAKYENANPEDIKKKMINPEYDHFSMLLPLNNNDLKALRKITEKAFNDQLLKDQ